MVDVGSQRVFWGRMKCFVFEISVSTTYFFIYFCICVVSQEAHDNNFEMRTPVGAGNMKPSLFILTIPFTDKNHQNAMKLVYSTIPLPNFRMTAYRICGGWLMRSCQIEKSVLRQIKGYVFELSVSIIFFFQYTFVCVLNHMKLMITILKCRRQQVLALCNPVYLS